MSARARVWIIVGARRRGRCGDRRRSHARRPATTSQQPVEQTAALRSGSDRPRRAWRNRSREALQAWPAARLGGSGSSPSATRTAPLSSSSSALRSRCRASRPTQTRAWQAARASPAGLPVGRQSPGSASSRQPARPAAVRAQLHARDERRRVPPAAAAPPTSRPCRPVSAEREFAAAAKAAPNNPEALTAAALGLYDKDRPALAFSRLGPLARRFPKAQTVRFHLGLLLIYFGDMPRARRELALARAQGPLTPLGKRAETLLKAGRNP